MYSQPRAEYPTWTLPSRAATSVVAPHDLAIRLQLDSRRPGPRIPSQK